MALCGVALAIMALVLYRWDTSLVRSSMEQDLETFAGVIGSNCSAALRFKYRPDADEILASLSEKPHIRRAAIFAGDGKLFASYLKAGTPEHGGYKIPALNGSSYDNQGFSVHLPIILNDETIGSIYIRSDLGALHDREHRYLVILTGVILMSLAVVFLLSWLMVKGVTRPILSLARTARLVSKKKDYSVRAVKYSDDEIGDLTQTFNGMLSRIQARDSALLKANRQVARQADDLQRELKYKRKMELALRASEERFRDLFDNAPDIYMILNPEGRIVDINQRGLKKLGYEASDVVGRAVTDIMSREDISRAEEVLQRLVSGKPVQNIEARLLSKSGDVRWVIKEFSLLTDESGNVLNIRVLCRDITERRRLQDELERARRLETAGRIAGQIAHDFNNLLGPLAAYPTMIREDLPKGHPVVDLVNEMEQAAEKIAEINQQLLSLGRRGHYSVQPINLNDLLDKVLLSHRLPKNSRVVIERRFARDISAITGGPAQLTRAFSNLFNNAFEALQGEGKLVIATQNIYIDEPPKGAAAVEPGEYVKLTISDTGSGIPAELIDKIFDPFFTTKTMDKMRGSGLGLSVVHGVIEDHHGCITVDSEVGKGATFTLYFPATPDEELKPAKKVVDLRGGNETILIVDDDAVQRKVTGHLLERLGYKISAVASGEEAVDFVQGQAPDLVVLDMIMEGIDGAETYRRLLEKRPGQKAIILSGYAMSRLVKQALSLGAGAFVPKPISLPELAQAVRSELDKPARTAGPPQRVQLAGHEVG